MGALLHVCILKLCLTWYYLDQIFLYIRSQRKFISVTNIYRCTHLCVGILRASQMTQWSGTYQQMQETWVQSLGWKGPLEEKMASYSSILAWEIPWTEATVLVGYSSWGRKRVRHNLATEQHVSTRVWRNWRDLAHIQPCEPKSDNIRSPDTKLRLHIQVPPLIMAVSGLQSRFEWLPAHVLPTAEPVVTAARLSWVRVPRGPPHRHESPLRKHVPPQTPGSAEHLKNPWGAVSSADLSLYKYKYVPRKGDVNTDLHPNST